MLASWLSRINEWQLWHRPVDVRGINLVPTTLDRWVALQAHRFYLMGRTELDFFHKVVGPGSYIADVGANQGLYTLYLSRLAPQGCVYSFEPDPKLFAALKENVERNNAKNVTLFNAAAASCSSRLFLRPGRFNRGDNRIIQDASGSNQVIQVDATSLDDAIPDQQLDVLKIDVQGFEADVLKGAPGLLATNERLLILLEFWPHGLRLAGSGPEQLLSLLEKSGFSIFYFARKTDLQRFTYDPRAWSRPDRFCNLVAAKDIGAHGFDLSSDPRGE